MSVTETAPHRHVPVRVTASLSEDVPAPSSDASSDIDAILEEGNAIDGVLTDLNARRGVKNKTRLAPMGDARRAPHADMRPALCGWAPRLFIFLTAVSESDRAAHTSTRANTHRHMQALARVASSGLLKGTTRSTPADSRRPAARRTPGASGARPRAGSQTFVVHASGDAAHSGIVDESIVHGSSLASNRMSTRVKTSVPGTSAGTSLSERIGIQGVHHVAVIVKNLDVAMEFYRDFLGLPVNPERPNDKLPYDGAWLMIGPEMVHLMELPNPDPTDAEFRPAHGGKDRHFCIGVRNLVPLTEALEERGTPFTASRSGRPAIFFRDPDCNTLEVVEGLEWRDRGDPNFKSR